MTISNVENAWCNLCHGSGYQPPNECGFTMLARRCPNMCAIAYRDEDLNPDKVKLIYEREAAADHEKYLSETYRDDSDKMK